MKTRPAGSQKLHLRLFASICGLKSSRLAPENISIENCDFEELAGNAVFVDGKHQATVWRGQESHQFEFEASAK